MCFLVTKGASTYFPIGKRWLMVHQLIFQFIGKNQRKCFTGREEFGDLYQQKSMPFGKVGWMARATQQSPSQIICQALLGLFFYKGGPFYACHRDCCWCLTCHCLDPRRSSKFPWESCRLFLTFGEWAQLQCSELLDVGKLDGGSQVEIAFAGFCLQASQISAINSRQHCWIP